MSIKYLFIIRTFKIKGVPFMILSKIIFQLLLVIL